MTKDTPTREELVGGRQNAIGRGRKIRKQISTAACTCCNPDRHSEGSGSDSKNLGFSVASLLEWRSFGVPQDDDLPEISAMHSDY